MKIHLELPEAKVSTLNVMMGEMGVSSYKDLLNNALTLLEWAFMEAKAGRAIASVDQSANQYRVLSMKIFDTPTANAQQKSTVTEGMD